MKLKLVATVVMGGLCVYSSGAQAAHPSVIVGATIVGLGGSADIADSEVVIRNGRIAAIGRRGEMAVPRHARIVDGRNRYLIPGLIDAFGAVRSQAFADAYLYEGVTTVVVPRAPAGSVLDGEQVIFRPNAGLSILTGHWISGYARNSDLRPDSPWLKGRPQRGRVDPEALRRQVGEAARAGDQVIDAALDLWPDQLSAIVNEAHRLGLAVFAEPAFSTYAEAVDAGVDAFLRNDRYSLWTAGSERFAAFAGDPFGGGGRAAIRAVCAGTEASPETIGFGALLQGGAALIPLLSMEATADDVGGPNPWTLPSAVFFQPSDLDDPVDPITGARPYLESRGNQAERARACARSKQAIDRALHKSGAQYVAGSSAPGFGVMPGSGLHVELQLLQGIGLSPREALEAATIRSAKALHLGDRGRVAVGQRADLVLLAENPAEDTAALDAIDAVFVDGIRIDRAALLQSAVRLARK